MKVDVVLLTALLEEHQALHDALLPHAASEETYQGICNKEYRILSLNTQHHGILRVALPHPLGTGQLAAAISTSEMLLDIAPSITLLVGIAGCMGDSSKFMRGDVVISNQIHDYEPRKESNGEVKPRWRTYSSDDQLVRRIGADLATLEWAEPLIPLRPNDSRKPSQAFIGNVFSGNAVLADDEVKAELLSRSPNPVLAIEMEAAGVAAVLQRDGTNNHFVMIKAFSDYAGSDKVDGAPDKDRFHEYACKSAAALTVGLLTSSIAGYARGLQFTPDAEDYFESKAHAALRCLISSTSNCPEFVSKMSRSVFEAAIEEVKELSKLATSPGEHILHHRRKSYSGVVSAGSNFLMRAEPLFSTASRIYAVSLGHVSQFWIDPNACSLVRHYIASHSFGETPNSRVMRLFVPRDPEEAHLYARRFDLHSERFPNTFVCSREHYERLLVERLAASAASLERLMRSDYAVLYQKNGTADHRYFAELDSENLNLIQAISENQPNLSLDSIEEWFQEVGKMTPGEYWRDLPVLKWRPGLWRDKELWSQCLQTMFETRTADVFHFFGVATPDGADLSEFRKKIARMKHDLANQRLGFRSLTRRYQIKGVRLAKPVPQIQSDFRDGVSRGRLKYNDQLVPNMVVITRAPDNESLKGYLEDPEHSRLRYMLLMQLASVNTEIAALFKRHSVSDEQSLAKAVEGLPELFEELEAAAGVLRFDLRDDELIHEIVETDPPQL